MHDFRKRNVNDTLPNSTSFSQPTPKNSKNNVVLVDVLTTEIENLKKNKNIQNNDRPREIKDSCINKIKSSETERNITLDDLNFFEEDDWDREFFGDFWQQNESQLKSVSNQFESSISDVNEKDETQVQSSEYFNWPEHDMFVNDDTQIENKQIQNDDSQRLIDSKKTPQIENKSQANSTQNKRCTRKISTYRESSDENYETIDEEDSGKEENWQIFSKKASKIKSKKKQPIQNESQDESIVRPSTSKTPPKTTKNKIIEQTTHETNDHKLDKIIKGQKKMVKIIKKVEKKVNQESLDRRDRETTQNQDAVMHNNINLAALYGETPAKLGLKISEHLFTENEMKECFLPYDPLNPNQTPVHNREEFKKFPLDKVEKFINAVRLGYSLTESGLQRNWQHIRKSIQSKGRQLRLKSDGTS